MDTLRPTDLKIVLNPARASEQQSATSLGWAGQGARALIWWRHTFPTRDPITRVHPMKQTPRKSAAKNSWGAGGVEVCN